LTSPELRDVRVSFDEAKKWLRMRRGSIEVMFNAGQATVTLPVDGRYDALLLSEKKVACNTDAIDLPSASVAVLRIK
jgi:maltooligosyltrehalose trehalohydrolase